jgi:hypothetical protein
MPQRGLRPWTDARTREALAAISAADQFLGSGLASEIDHDAVEAELDYIVASAAGGRRSRRRDRDPPPDGRSSDQRLIRSI